MMNPLLPTTEQDKQLLSQVCQKGHAEFIEFVKEHRKGRLDLARADVMFSG